MKVFMKSISYLEFCSSIIEILSFKLKIEGNFYFLKRIAQRTGVILLYERFSHFSFTEPFILYGANVICYSVFAVQCIFNKHWFKRTDK